MPKWIFVPISLLYVAALLMVCDVTFTWPHGFEAAPYLMLAALVTLPIVAYLDFRKP
jgi:hypothetical protein